ncbi:phosphotransferase enzyme family protein [Kushneria aurantia]|uniref:Phosphotransferase enzyme family protein n=1 Tax=Kushneria aurantia TaxID=504092 RepID=A0ABV6G8K1_9GAMM|nr:phosphotransferase [Kushneria aurantia]
MAGLYDDEMMAALEHGVHEAKAQWGLSAEASIRLLTVSENATFLATPPGEGRSLVLRVHRPGYHTYSEIASELAWIEALRTREVITTPAPIACTDGNYIATFRMAGETRPIVAFEFMHGVEPSTNDRLHEGFRQLGSISARLHQHARQWQRPPHFTRKIWNFETTLGVAPHWGDWRVTAGMAQSTRATLESTCEVIRSRLAAYGTDPERFGLIHADLRLANLLMQDERLAVIDFDDCGFGWFGYDFAAAVSFFEDDPIVSELLSAWVSGYRRVASLAEADEAMLSTFVMLRRLLLTAWLASHSETPTAQETGASYIDGTLALAERFLTDNYFLSRH